MLKSLMLGACTALMLSACVTAPTRVALSADSKKELSATGAYIFVSQDEILVKAQPGGVSAAMGGGLIGALIDSSIDKGRQGDIQTAIEPFYAAVDDLDVRKQLSTALRTGLGTNFAIKIDPIESATVAMSKLKLDAQKAALTPQKGFMQIGTTYTFSPDFSRLNMSTHVDLWQGGKGTPVYTNNFFYQSASVGASGTGALNAWASNNGARYREAVDEAIAQIVKMIRLDVSADSADPVPGNVTTIAKVDGPATLKVTGPIMDSQKNRAIVRHTDGRLYSLPQ